MTYRFEVTARIAARRVIAIVRAGDPDVAVAAGDALVEAGIDVLEVALTTPDGLDAIRTLARRHPDALVGAGTVLDAASARLATLAGARFLVAPSLSLDVIAAGHRYGAAVLPGVRTPTEIVAALEAGADLLKLFPADDLGPDHLRALRAPLPQAPLVPTGGIDQDNARAWLDAGAVALGVGSWLTRDPARAGERAAALLRVLAS